MTCPGCGSRAVVRLANQIVCQMCTYTCPFFELLPPRKRKPRPKSNLNTGDITSKAAPRFELVFFAVAAFAIRN
jgi:hypothetical protein